MRAQTKRVIPVAFVFLVSIFGLAISAALLGKPASGSEDPTNRRVIIALVYDLVCAAGILAALFPVLCSGVVGSRRLFAEHREDIQRRTTEILGIRFLHGHHPVEPESAAHELLIGGKSYCATCYGLLSGAVFSLTVVTAFSLSSWSGWAESGLVLFVYCVGVAAVILGFIQTLTLRLGPRARFAAAMAFVVGTSLMLLATDLLTADLAADFFVVLLAVFSLLSRISLSHRS